MVVSINIDSFSRDRSIGYSTLLIISQKPCGFEASCGNLADKPTSAIGSLRGISRTLVALAASAVAFVCCSTAIMGALVDPPGKDV